MGVHPDDEGRPDVKEAPESEYNQSLFAAVVDAAYEMMAEDDVILVWVPSKFCTEFSPGESCCVLSAATMRAELRALEVNQNPMK